MITVGVIDTDENVTWRRGRHRVGPGVGCWLVGWVVVGVMLMVELLLGVGWWLRFSCWLMLAGGG